MLNMPSLWRRASPRVSRRYLTRKPKALFEVRGEILIERQIEQLMESGVPSIVIVTGYKSDMFTYLADKYHVKLIFNET